MGPSKPARCSYLDWAIAAEVCWEQPGAWVTVAGFWLLGVGWAWLARGKMVAAGKLACVAGLDRLAVGQVALGSGGHCTLMGGRSSGTR